MRTPAVVLTVVLWLGFGVIAQSASAQMAGEDEGVTAVRGSHGIVLRFGPRAARVYRRIAGRRVVVSCSTVSPLGGGFSEDGGSSESMRAPRRGRRIRTFTGGRVDYCSVRLGKPTRELVAPRRSPTTGAPSSTSGDRVAPDGPVRGRRRRRRGALDGG